MKRINKLFYILFAVIMLWSCSSGSSKSGNNENVAGGAKYVTVTFESGGAESGSMAQYRAEYGVPFNLPKNTFEKSGYTFAGWIVSGSQVKYADESEVTLYSDTVLQAEWSKIDESAVYSIVLKSNNGTNEEIVYNAAVNEKVSLPYEPFVKEGSIIAGWSKTAGGSIDYYDREVFSADKNLELYAVWTPYNQEEVVTVTFDGNGGAGYDYPKNPVGGKIFLDWTSFKKDGFAFLGWSERQNSKYPSYKDGSEFTAKRSMTLFAVWGDKNDSSVISFTFNKSNSSTCFIPDELSGYIGDNIIIPSLETCANNSLVGVGYVDGSGTKYFESEEIRAEQDLLIDVIWSDGSRTDFAGQTKWVYGVNVGQDDWVVENKAVWRETSNWYDIYQHNWFLCWAASGANIILWWYNNNKEYVDKYISQKGYNGPAIEYNSEGSSPIFDYFTTIFPNDGGVPTVAFNYFVLGNQNFSGGGYFKDVFNNKILTYKTGIKNIDKITFNYLLSDAIENKKAVAMHVIIGGPHIVTVWGADYGADGFINRIYISNSNSYNRDYNGLKGDLEKCDIQYSSTNLAQMLCSDYALTEISEIFTFSLGTELWQEYFKNN